MVEDVVINKEFSISFVKKEKVYINIKLGNKSVLLPVEDDSTISGIHDKMSSFIDELMQREGIEELFTKYGIIIE